jgi:hypothetical protein
VGWKYGTPTDTKAVTLEGDWSVEFLEGGPSLPAPRRVPSLSDWTQWSAEADQDALRNFSGTARYTLEFNLPPSADTETYWSLDLGTVCHSASVRLNEHAPVPVISRPWRVTISPGTLRPERNVLEIEVTNLMANRLADLERRKGDTWRPFLMVNIHYKPFDAAAWAPVRSGLIGPVTLTPLPSSIPEIKDND